MPKQKKGIWNVETPTKKEGSKEEDDEDVI